MGHIRSSGPGSGIGSQVKVFKPCEQFPLRLEAVLGRSTGVPETASPGPPWDLWHGPAVGASRQRQLRVSEVPLIEHASSIPNIFS